MSGPLPEHGVFVVVLATGAGCFNPNLNGPIACMDGLCPPGLSCDINRVCREPSEVGTDAAAFDALALLDAPASETFGAPVLISEVQSYAADPELSSSGLELYFRVGEPEGPTDIFVTTRASLSAPWEEPSLVDELRTAMGEFDPRLSADGLTIWFSRGDISVSEILVASRDAIGSEWSIPVSIAELVINNSANFSFSVTADEMHAAFTSTRDIDVDIYLTDRIDDEWSNIRSAEALNLGDTFDGSAELSSDGLTIYFDSSRSGGRKLYRARRNAVDEPFFAPALIGELDDGEQKEDPSISADERTIVFSSEQGGERRLYQAQR